MSTVSIVEDLDAEIARLEEAKKTLSKTNNSAKSTGARRILKSSRGDALHSIRKTPIQLPTIFQALDGPGGTASDGVAITSYGQGQLSGVTYTVPAHGVITVDFDISLLCVTPNDIDNLSALIRSLL